jgi:hypothetical protein
VPATSLSRPSTCFTGCWCGFVASLRRPRPSTLVP